MSGSGGGSEGNDRLIAVLAVLVLVQVSGLVGGALLDTGTAASAVLAVGLLAPVPAAVLIYRDLRRFRQSERWQPPLRGALWVVGGVLPLLSISVAGTYLVRSWTKANGTRFERWHWLAATGLALTVLPFFIVGATNDPAASGNTPAQNAALFLLLAATPLGPLAGYFDTRFLTDHVPDRDARERYVWPYLFAIWFLNVPLFASYLYLRRRSMESISDAETTLSEQLSTVDERVEAAEDAIEAGDFESATDAVDGAESALEAAETAAERLDSESAAGEIAERRSRLDALRPRAAHGERLAEAERLAGESAEVAERGRRMLDEGAFRDAVDALTEAERGLGRAVETMPEALDGAELDFDRDLEGYRRTVADRRDRALERLTTERAAPLADRISALVAQVDRTLEAGGLEALDRAERLLDEARDDHETLADLLASYDLDIDPDVDAATLDDRRERLARRQRMATVEERLAVADEREAAGEEALEAGEYERAESAFREARDAVDAAADLATEHGLADAFDDLDGRRSSLDGRIGSAARQRRRTTYEDALERGESRLGDARTAVDREAYDEAIAACDDAYAAFEDAHAVAAEHGVGDTATVEERLDELGTVRTEVELARLSARVTDSRDAVAELSADDASPEAYESVAADCRDLIETIDGLDIDRERDLAVLRREAGRELVRAEAAAARQRAEDATAAFDDGEYTAARDAFEAVEDSVHDVAATADDLGVEPDIDLERLRAVCSSNADAARRAVLGIEDDPTRRSLPDPDGSGASTDGRSAGQHTTTVAASSAGSGATATDGVTDQLRAELPDHEVLDFIGSGGNADVHKVRLDTGEVAALKVPRWEGTLSTEVVERFTREAETWAKLDDHDHIVTVLEWGQQPYPWLLLEYLDASLADRAGELAVPSSLDILTDVCDALEFAHGRGVVHLDVKPENVLLTDDDRARVGDWGLARVLLQHSHTQLGLTPPYSAPEQLTQEYGDVDRRTDVYQASVLGYRMLTGRLPFEADRPADLQRAILQGTPTPPSELDDTLDPAVDDVLLRGMARDPADRYETAVLLRNALADLA